MDTETQEYIKLVIRESTTEAMTEFTRSGFIKPIKDDAFQKTEKVLINYKKLKKVIEDKRQLIESIKSEGLKRSSKSIVTYSSNTAYEVLTDGEKADAKIASLEHSIGDMSGYIETVDDALRLISVEPYFDIINMLYFEGRSREYIAEHFEVDVATISRNKTRLINVLKIYLFPDASIMELFQ